MTSFSTGLEFLRPSDRVERSALYLDGSAAVIDDAADIESSEQPESSTLFDLWDVVKRWPRHSRPVLDGVELSVERGTAIRIGGRNGIGKTTLLRIASGLIKPDRGSISLAGLHPDHHRRAYQKRIAFLTAGDRGLYARLSPRRHLDFWARLNLVPAPERQQLVQKALDRMSISDFADRRADRLSMGQRQRVRLAGLFFNDPDLVMLDEPRNSLDEEGIAQMVSVLREVVSRGGAVIWCSPAGDTVDMELDATYILEDGQLKRQ